MGVILVLWYPEVELSVESCVAHLIFALWPVCLHVWQQACILT